MNYNDLDSVMAALREKRDAQRNLADLAPHLLAALQPFVLHKSSEETTTITVRTADVTRARALIAKATGEQA